MFPHIPADVRTVTAAQAAAGLAITNLLTLVRMDLTADTNLALVASAELPDGAQVVLDIGSDTTARTTTPGTGFLSATPTIGGVISKRRTTTYVFSRNQGGFKLLVPTTTIN